MERLNDIINKATQRRQYSQQQQQQQRAAQQQQPYGSSRQPQGQRSAAPNQPVPPAQQHYAQQPQMPQIPPTPLVQQTRQMPAYRHTHTRASAEQMAQQDQNSMQRSQNTQRTPNSHPSNYSQQMSSNKQRYTGEESVHPIPRVEPQLSQTSVRPLHPSFPRQQQVPKTPSSSPMQQRSEERGGMSSRSSYYTQEQANSMPSAYAHGNYQNDPNSNYQAPMPADVMTGDEEEVTMEYGDWEGENEEGASYQPREAEIYTPVAPPASRSTYASHYGQPYMAREQYAAYAPEGELPSPQARDAQEMHRPPVAKHVPVTRIQEIPTYHSKTQQLDTAMEARFGSGAAAHMQHMQEPSRQLIARETLTPASTNIQMLTKAVCAKCKGAGYRRADVPFGHPNFGKPIACECKEAERKEKRRQQLVELSDLSAFHDKHFDNFNTRIPGIHPSVIEAWKEAYHFAQNPKGWLVFIGTNGCGKTHLASAIANQSLNDGMMVLFSVVPELLDHLRSAFAPTATQVYDQLFSKMREAELLVLDDLGAHYSTPWATEKLYQLLNYRYSWSMPTVITTNNVGLQSIDIRLSSRMMDSSLVTVINLEHAKDRRPYLPRRDM